MKKLIYIVLVLMQVGAVAKHDPLPVFQINPISGGCSVPIEFDGSAGQKIQFAAIPAIDNLTQKTLAFWFVLDVWGAPTTSHRIVDKIEGTANGWTMGLVNAPGLTNRFNYVHRWSGGNGVWYSDDNAVVAGTIYHLVITYDGSSDANDPVFYLNGSSVNVNETGAPSGTITDDSANVLTVGSDSGGTITLDGKLWNFRVYDYIWSAADAADDYNAKAIDQNDRGIKLHCPMLGATGLQTFEGASLGASNTIIDRVAGYVGTPSGSPVGRGDAMLHFADRQWQEGRGGS